MPLNKVYIQDYEKLVFEAQRLTQEQNKIIENSFESKTPVQTSYVEIRPTIVLD